jgi:F0F1-type ATP synthase assembly protein I
MPGDEDKSGLRFIGLGTEFAAGFVGLTLLGLWIDHHFEVAPWGLVVGLFIGLVGGTYNLIRGVVSVTRRPERAEDRSEKTEQSPGPGKDNEE